jgi:hypothetical protein
MYEYGLPPSRLLGQVERPHLLAQDFRVEQRFGFDSHLLGKRLVGAGKKPSAFLPGPSTQPRTLNLKAALVPECWKSLLARETREMTLKRLSSGSPWLSFGVIADSDTSIGPFWRCLAWLAGKCRLQVPKSHLRATY